MDPGMDPPIGTPVGSPIGIAQLTPLRDQLLQCGRVGSANKIDELITLETMPELRTNSLKLELRGFLQPPLQPQKDGGGIDNVFPNLCQFDQIFVELGEQLQCPVTESTSDPLTSCLKKILQQRPEGTDFDHHKEILMPAWVDRYMDGDLANHAESNITHVTMVEAAYHLFDPDWCIEWNCKLSKYERYILTANLIRVTIPCLKVRLKKRPRYYPEYIWILMTHLDRDLGCLLSEDTAKKMMVGNNEKKKDVSMKMKKMMEEAKNNGNNMAFGCIMHGGSNCAHHAAIAGNITRIVQLIRTPTSRKLLNGRDRHGDTPLHTATNLGQNKIVELLCSKAAETDVYALDCEGSAPLHNAVKLGLLSTVKTMIASGMNMNVGNTKPDLDHPLHTQLRRMYPKNQPNTLACGLTALHMAAMTSQNEILQLILETSTVNINARDGQSTTPFAYAGNSSNPRAALLLARHGADVDAHQELGCTALHFAASRGKTDMVRYLVESLGVNRTALWQGETARQHALKMGYHTTADMMQQLRACASTRTSCRKTPIHACGGCKTVKYCCQEHAKADWKMHKKDCKRIQRNRALSPLVPIESVKVKSQKGTIATDEERKELINLEQLHLLSSPAQIERNKIKLLAKADTETPLVPLPLRNCALCNQEEPNPVKYYEYCVVNERIGSDHAHFLPCCGNWLCESCLNTKTNGKKCCICKAKKPKTNKILSLYRKQAEEGNPHAQFHFAQYLAGEHTTVEGDFVTSKYGNLSKSAAVHWYETAANNGHLPSHVCLGFEYMLGITARTGSSGVVKNYEKAFYWLKRASNVNFVPAKYFLGNLLAFGGFNEMERCLSHKEDMSKVPFNSEAAQLFCSAGSQGHFKASLVVGVFKSQGHDMCCFMCSKISQLTTTCAGCKFSFYCSAKCRKAAKKSHRKVCQIMKGRKI